MIAVNFNILNQKGAPAVFEDEAANRPPAGLVGRLFIATDTKTLQRDNGTAYDTIGDNSLLGARNGLTLAGNYVELGGTLIKHTAIAGNYNIALGSAAVANIKFLCTETSNTILDGAASIVGSKLLTPQADVSTQNFYITSGNLLLDLTNAKITGANSLNATALNGYVNINGNNGQSTRAIRSIMATGVFNNVNLAEFRSIDIKAYDFNGTNAITNAYGLYIDTIKAGAVTNAYGIYQSGVNDKNYFAGAVDIGSALTGTSASFSSNITISTVTEEAKINFIKTGANQFSFQHDDARFYLYNNTTAGVPISILNNNSIGIGHADPDITGGLHVKNGAAYFSKFQTTRTGGGVVFLNFANASNSFRGGVGFNPIDNYFRVSSNGGGLLLEVDGGNVGIGTTSPAYKLDVNGTANITGALTGTSASFSGTVKLQGYTVATLPTGTVGMTAYVTDALAPTFGATLVGGGAVTTKAFFNGTNWVNE